MPIKRKRPVFLDLTRIHQPVNAVLSITHRLTGIALVVMIPVVLSLLDRSLASEDGFAAVAQMLHGLGFRLVLIAFAWVFAHHFFAGIRYLLLDADVGVEIHRAKASAWLVFAGGAAVMLIVAAAVLT